MTARAKLPSPSTIQSASRRTSTKKTHLSDKPTIQALRLSKRSSSTSPRSRATKPTSMPAGTSIEVSARAALTMIWSRIKRSATGGRKNKKLRRYRNWWRGSKRFKKQERSPKKGWKNKSIKAKRYVKSDKILNFYKLIGKNQSPNSVRTPLRKAKSPSKIYSNNDQRVRSI